MKEGQKFLIVAICSTIFIYGLKILIGVVFKRNSMQLRGYKVLTLSTALLDNITDEKLIQNLFKIAMEAYEGAKLDKKEIPDDVSLTLKSLFKQIKEGDADETKRQKQKTDPDKYNIWL